LATSPAARQTAAPLPVPAPGPGPGPGPEQGPEQGGPAGGGLPASACAAPETAPVLLAVEGLLKRYEAGEPVLRDIGFRLQAGEAVALIGANGSGKSTLLHCCTRLIEPSAGRIELLGEEIAGLSRRGLRRLRARVGLVSQRHNLVGRLPVLSNVLHGALARDGGPRHWRQAFASRAAREEALYWLEQVGLADFAARRADRLSGGQSQRVAIARALMQRPARLMADEPVASLDPQAGEEVMALFAELARDHGLTLFFTTHHLQHALDYGGRVLALKRGLLALDAASGTLRAEELRGLYV
jgi:phosphonate transport system ATP-binding protein